MFRNSWNYSPLTTSRKTTAMPPKAKEGKEKTLTEAEAKKMVLEYLDRENRPFNEKLIFENLQLKDRVKPATYKKVIEDLISAGDITEKTVKKAKILFADQSKKPEVDKVGLQKMEGDIAQLRDEYENLQVRLRELEQERNQLKQQLTNEELEEELKKYTKENEELSARLEGFRSGTQKPITAEEKKKIENAYKSTKTAWKSRKRMFSEISSTFQENMDPKQFKKMRVDLGISTDEENKVHPDNDNTSKFVKSATGK